MHIEQYVRFIFLVEEILRKEKMSYTFIRQKMVIHGISLKVLLVIEQYSSMIIA